MSFMARDNAAIKVTPSLEQEIADAKSTSEITAALHRAALSQGIVEKDPFDKDGTDWSTMHVIERPQPRAFATVVTIDGVKHVLEAGTEQELLAKETELYRAALAAPAATTEQPRNSAGQFVSQAEIDAEAARVAELASVNPMHRIEAELVERALANQGISIATLREVEGMKFQNSWAEATAEFLRTAGADWPGGENMDVAAQLIAENGLEDKPSAETLAAVWNHMKDNNLTVENSAFAAEEAREKAIRDAKTPDELRAAVGYKDPSSSGLWGR
jgi:hypothetical protein